MTEVWRPPVTVTIEMGGSRVELIPLGPSHRDLLADAFGRLSDRSRYLRFMAPVPTLSASDLTYLTELDLVDRFAWGVLVDGEPAAVGRYIKTGDGVGEVALTVLDAHQGRGLGTLLVGALSVVALDVGLTTLEFEVLAENRAMLSVLDHFGASRQSGEGVVHAVVETASVPPPIDAAFLLAAVESARQQPTRMSSTG